MTIHNDQIDLIAQPDTQIEIDIQSEVGVPNKFKLYVHVDGVTVLRICKLTKEQIHFLKYD